MWDRYSVDDATEKEVEDASGDVSESKSGDSSLRDWFGKSRSSDGTPGWVQLGGKYAGKPCAKQPGQTTKPKCGSSKMKRNLDKDEEQAAFRRKQRQDPNPDRKGKAINVKTEEVITEKKGEKDACYKKVKSRYSVWPSAYASGALVKCRKVGADNWGNKSESYDFSNWRDDFKALEIETLNLIEPEPIKGGQAIDEKCWVGYKQVGMKKKGDKVVPNCVKEEELNEIHKQAHTPHEIPSKNLKNLVKKAVKRIDTDADGDVDHNDKAKGELGEFIPGVGNKRLYSTTKPKTAKESFSDWRSELDEKLNLQKAEMGDVVTDFYKSDAPQFKGKSKEKRREMAVAAKLSAMREDWQKVNKSDKTDGMSPAAVKAYRRENPGSKLKTAVTGDPKPGSKDAKRRKSFCARSKGQQDMHNIDCSKTPDKPVCKARRRWKC